MAKKSITYYEKKLRQMIKERRKVDNVESWIEAQIEAAAMNWQMMVSLHDEIINGKFVSLEHGSTGQTKTIVNPLLSTYRDVQRTHILHLEALGLNFKTQPTKMTESGAVGSDDDDPLVNLVKYYKGMTGE